MNWYLAVLKNYVGFSGRAGRTEFWTFTLTNIVISIVLDVIDLAIGTTLLSILFTIAMLLPGLAVTVRRLHDTGKSGWWILIGIIPFIGFIVLLIFTLGRGDSQPNAHGPVPSAVPATA